jgi:hypothetical protein
MIAVSFLGISSEKAATFRDHAVAFRFPRPHYATPLPRATRLAKLAPQPDGPR